MQFSIFNRIRSVLIDLKSSYLNIISFSKSTWQFLEITFNKLNDNSEYIYLIFANAIDKIEFIIICQSQIFTIWKRFMKEINNITLACIIKFHSKQRKIKDFHELLKTTTSSTLIIQKKERQKNQDNLESLKNKLNQIQDKNRELWIKWKRFISHLNAILIIMFIYKIIYFEAIHFQETESRRRDFVLLINISSWRHWINYNHHR